MKRTDREITRSLTEARRYKERELKLKIEAEEAERIAAVQAAIAKNNNKKSLLDKFGFSPSEFWLTIEKKTPRLLDSDYIYQLNLVSLLEHHRPISDWEPKGKGKDTIFNSLCDHLLAKFKTPAFIWSAFWEIDVEDIARKLSLISTNNNEFITKPDTEGRYIDIECSPIIQAVIRIARGESFAKMCKFGDFPVKLTNKQCHQFLSSNSDSTFLSALRRTQIQTWGGDNRLLKVLMNIHYPGGCLNGIVAETFLDSMIAWFSKNPMLDPEQFGPIMDFILIKRAEDKNFSMKGRSAMAVIKAMEDWHQDLAKKKIAQNKEYKPSGLKSAHYEYDHRTSSGNYERVHYDIKEILNSKELHAEGKALRHCVLSYSGSIEAGNCSIWSMKLNEYRAITIEVRARSIVQARGSCNRRASSEEFKIMQRWANENGIGINLPNW